MPPPGVDDLQGDADMLLRPLTQGTGIALIRPDELQPREGRAQGAQDQLRPLAIMQARGMDDHFEQQPQRIDEHMPLAPEDFLAAIKPTWSPLVGPNGLTVG